MFTLLQGPVGTAAHGGRTNPWFPIAVGAVLLIYPWGRHLKLGKEANLPVGKLVGFSAICLVFIAIGTWELVH